MPGMIFGLNQNLEDQVANRRAAPPLQAGGNLSYLEFIELVTTLWEEMNPGVPLLPMQDGKFAKYPCVVYSLELRTPFKNEAKKVARGTRIDDGGELHRVTAQRFNNFIKFTAITKDEPKLAESIIEAFEDFMYQYTPAFKQLGLSDIFYNRRISDTDETRDSQDVCKRAVVYKVVIEKLISTHVARLREIILNVRIRMSDNSDVFTADGGDRLTLDNHGFVQDQPVIIKSVWLEDGTSLPYGLNSGFVYLVDSVTDDTFELTTVEGLPVHLSTTGAGRVYAYTEVSIPVTIEDGI